MVRSLSLRICFKKIIGNYSLPGTILSTPDALLATKLRPQMVVVEMGFYADWGVREDDLELLSEMQKTVTITRAEI